MPEKRIKDVKKVLRSYCHEKTFFLVVVRLTTVRRGFQMSDTRFLPGHKMLLEPKAVESNSADFSRGGAKVSAEVEP